MSHTGTIVKRARSTGRRPCLDGWLAQRQLVAPGPSLTSFDTLEANEEDALFALAALASCEADAEEEPQEPRATKKARTQRSAHPAASHRVRLAARTEAAEPAPRAPCVEAPRAAKAAKASAGNGEAQLPPAGAPLGSYGGAFADVALARPGPAAADERPAAAAEVAHNGAEEGATSGAAAPARPQRAAFKRSALHVYIAHLIAYQAQHGRYQANGGPAPAGAAAEPLGVLGRRGSVASADGALAAPPPALPAHLAPGAGALAFGGVNPAANPNPNPAAPPAAPLGRGGAPGCAPMASQATQPFAHLVLPGGHTAYTFLPGAGLPGLTPAQAAAAMAAFPFSAALGLASGLPGGHLANGSAALSAAFARPDLPLEDMAAGAALKADDSFKRPLGGFGGADAVARLQALGLPALLGAPNLTPEQLALAAAAAGHRGDLPPALGGNPAPDARLHSLPGVPLMR